MWGTIPQEVHFHIIKESQRGLEFNFPLSLEVRRRNVSHPCHLPYKFLPPEQVKWQLKWCSSFTFVAASAVDRTCAIATFVTPVSCCSGCHLSTFSLSFSSSFPVFLDKYISLTLPCQQLVLYCTFLVRPDELRKSDASCM